MMRAAQPLALALALVLSAPASAQKLDGPTPAQMLERPPVTEIVGRWLSVCVEHAGNAEAQAQSARASGLTWPYQLIQRDDPDLGETCGVISTVAAGDDTVALEHAVRTGLGSRNVVTEIGDGMVGGYVTIDRRTYRILGNVDQEAGQPLPTAVIVLSSGRRNIQ